MARKSSYQQSNNQLTIDQLMNVDAMPMEEFAEQAYLDYSMYVILDRALPNIADGLKPVQRRIVYAMHELNLRASAKYKKSARTVGDVIGKFHPHGETACYDAMALMAQPFSFRYPIVDGQGNWGTQDDPKSFAAMRYTEARLTAYANTLLSEIDEGTVDWLANFDGTLNEPKLLPARLPNVLLNGASGIAVGMATDIPPHNLREVISACIRLLEYPKTSLEELCEHILGPDYPTNAEIITSVDDIQTMYAQGTGSIKQRAVWQKQGNDIIVSALPHQASGSKIQEQIAAQIIAKKLTMVADVRDESDQDEPTRLIIEQRSNRVDTDMLMNHLFATTDLERSYRVNLNLIDLNGRPRVFDLKSLLVEWLAYRKNTITNRLQFRLDNINNRLHILQGLLIAYLNIDEVIAIIRYEDEPKQDLIARFDLSETQADAILNLRLKNLAQLEEIKITDESNALSSEKKQLTQLLSSAKKLKALMREELLRDAKEYGDERRSPLKQREAAKAMQEQDLIVSETITVILSSNGWIKSAKGHDTDATKLNYRTGDEFLHAVKGKSTDMLVLIDDSGRCYSLPGHNLPSARGFGEPITKSITPASGVSVVGLMIGDDHQRYLLSSQAGYGFIAKLGKIYTKNKKGKSVITIKKNLPPLMPYLLSSDKENLIAVVTSVGYLLIFNAKELPELAKGKGNKLINIPVAKLKSGEENVVGCVVFQRGNHLHVHSGKRYLHLRPSQIEHYLATRAKRGKLLPKGYRNIWKLDVK